LPCCSNNIPGDRAYPIDDILKKAREFREYEFHRNIAANQRSSYKNNINDIILLEEALVIEIDFKQKVMIGISPRQVNAEFYENEKRTFLG